MKISPFYRGVLCVLALMVFMGAGRKYLHVQKVYQNEGDTPKGISVTCDDSAWTTVVSSSPIRRSVVIQSLNTNTVNVCVSTATAGNCVDGMVGYELAPNGSISDFSEAKLNCKARTGGSEILKGMEYEDSRDSEDR